MKVIAVIVTYNRLTLLKKCLKAVAGQSRRPDEIIVVNNGSTDDTRNWLYGQPVLARHQENRGGAGGFSAGINEAFGRGADWIWLMDDDTIPNEDALQQLLEPLAKMKQHEEKIGFLSSKVLWTDGNFHEMNRTYSLHDPQKLAQFSFVQEAGYPLIQFSTFVSMLLSAKAVRESGLPIEEYFIWCDDVEYSKRIIRSGMAGLAVPESVVFHETSTNHQCNVLIDPESAIWKYRYGMRNELHTKRLHEGALRFWSSWVHRMLLMPFRILLKRKSHRWSYIKMIWVTSLSALFFRPAIKKADGGSMLSRGDAAGSIPEGAKPVMEAEPVS